jgi:hypothetical protein
MRYDDDIEIVPIPLDQLTIARLARLGRITGGRPSELAGLLLRDLMRDDEEFNVSVVSISQPH